jgi:hypothetical protein
VVLKRFLTYALPALSLFVCVWVTRVFVAVDLVALVMPMTGLNAIAAVAVVGGLLPSLPLGFAYGLLRPRPVLGAAFMVALIASLLELAFASLTVPWWSFLTWWVLPAECAVVLASFPAAAAVGERFTRRARPDFRRRAGVAVFIVVTLCAIVWPWLQGCIRMGACGVGG